MRHFLGLGCFLLFLVWPSLIWAAEARQGIVVWRIEKKAGVSEQDIDSLSGYIASEVERASNLRAISDSDIATILKGEQTKQQCGGEASSCVAEIGAALGVPLAVAGDLGKVDKYWFLNIKLINVHNAQVEKRVSRKISGSLGDLIDALPGAINELFKERQLKTTPTPVAPSVAPAAKTAEKAQDEEPKPAAKQEPVSEKPAAPAKPMSAMNKAAFATFFTGVGLVVVGGVSQWQMGKAKDTYEASRGTDSGAKSKHSTFKALTFVGYGLGGAAMLTGAVLWIVDATRKTPQTEGQAVSFGVAPSPHGASVTLVGRW